MEQTRDGRQRYKMSVEDYVAYQKNGYLIVKGLFAGEDIQRLKAWTEAVYEGRINLDRLSPQFDWSNVKDGSERLASARVHMPHNHDATAEWALLYPPMLDALQALIGPDVLSLQSMLFFNPPGKGGQGWHQDSYYIQTQPDTLIGSWIAVDRADEQNGCLWVAPGSHREPIYPPAKLDRFVHVNEQHLDGLFTANAVSNMDDEVNNLTPVAAKYGQFAPVVLEPGDVLFFHSHLLHRSYQNETKDRFRTAYVCHYCNARSWVPWNHGRAYEGEAANYKHILARGRTHLPFASPGFGTPVELSPAPASGQDKGTMNLAMPDGMTATEM